MHLRYGIDIAPLIRSNSVIRPQYEFRFILVKSTGLQCGPTQRGVFRFTILFHTFARFFFFTSVLHGTFLKYYGSTALILSFERFTVADKNKIIR